MPIYRTAAFTVKPAGLAEAKMAIAEYVATVSKKERRTRLYLSLQNQEDPSRFVHVMAFDDAAGEVAHQNAAHHQKFSSVLLPLTVEGVKVTACAPIGIDAPAKSRRASRKVAKKPQRRAAKKKLAVRSGAKKR